MQEYEYLMTKMATQMTTQTVTNQPQGEGERAPNYMSPEAVKTWTEQGVFRPVQPGFDASKNVVQTKNDDGYREYDGDKLLENYGPSWKDPNNIDTPTLYQLAQHTGHPIIGAKAALKKATPEDVAEVGLPQYLGALDLRKLRAQQFGADVPAYRNLAEKVTANVENLARRNRAAQSYERADYMDRPYDALSTELSAAGNHNHVVRFSPGERFVGARPISLPDDRPTGGDTRWFFDDVDTRDGYARNESELERNNAQMAVEDDTAFLRGGLIPVYRHTGMPTPALMGRGDKIMLGDPDKAPLINRKDTRDDAWITTPGFISDWKADRIAAKNDYTNPENADKLIGGMSDVAMANHEGIHAGNLPDAIPLEAITGADIPGFNNSTYGTSNWPEFLRTLAFMKEPMARAEMRKWRAIDNLMNEASGKKTSTIADPFDDVYANWIANKLQNPEDYMKALEAYGLMDPKNPKWSIPAQDIPAFDEPEIARAANAIKSGLDTPRENVLMRNTPDALKEYLPLWAQRQDDRRSRVLVPSALRKVGDPRDTLRHIVPQLY